MNNESQNKAHHNSGNQLNNDFYLDSQEFETFSPFQSDQVNETNNDHPSHNHENSISEQEQYRNSDFEFDEESIADMEEDNYYNDINFNGSKDFEATDVVWKEMDEEDEHWNSVNDSNEEETFTEHYSDNYEVENEEALKNEYEDHFNSEYENFHGPDNMDSNEELYFENQFKDESELTETGEEEDEDTLENEFLEQSLEKMETETYSPGIYQMLLWYSSASRNKKFLPNEPIHNFDQIPIPAWLNADEFFNEFKQKHGADAMTIIGDPTKKVNARYFVIHDTAVTRDITKSGVDKEKKGIHLWLNSQSPVLRGYNMDWHKPGLGVKLEQSRNNCFVHIELSRDKELFKALQRKTGQIKDNFNVKTEEIIKAGGIKNFGTIYTDKQYELLAYAYIVASIRKGKFLTVTMHREVDRNVVKRRKGEYASGHNDPHFFDIEYFYKIVAGLLKIPYKVTFGIQNERALALRQGNLSGYVNEFIPFVTGDAEAANQYNPLTKLKPISVKYKIVKLIYGYSYDVTNLKNQLEKCKSEETIVFQEQENFVTSIDSTPIPQFISEDLSVPGYTCYVKIHIGKGNYPLDMTGIYVPSSFNPALPVDVILYLHGMTGTFPGGYSRIKDYWSVTKLPEYDLRIREEINAGGKNVVLVAPSMGKSPNSYINTLSGKKGGLDDYLGRVLSAVNTYIVQKRYNAPAINFRNVILSAHSAGGRQMRMISAQSNPVYGPKIIECWGFDSLYTGVKGWLEWAKNNPEKKLFIYFKFSTAGNAKYLQEHSKQLSNIFIKSSSAKNHYWVPKHHLKVRVTGIGQSNLTKTNFEASPVQDQYFFSDNDKYYPESTDSEYLYDPQSETSFYESDPENEFDEHEFIKESIIPEYQQFLNEVNYLVKDWSNAIRLNRNYGNSLGWSNYYDQINNLLLPFSGYQNVSLGEEAFAQAVANWQLKQGFTSTQSDGIIGPSTWAKMQPFLNKVVQPPPASTTYANPAPTSGQNIFNNNKWFAQKILDAINAGIIGANAKFNPKTQLEMIILGLPVEQINPKSTTIQILPIMYHICNEALRNNYREIAFGSFIRGINNGVCKGHCEGRCIDINYSGGSFESPGSARMVINILNYLLSLPTKYKKPIGFGMPLQGEFFGKTTLNKFSSVPATHLINNELKQLVPKLGYVFPDNDNHLHIQVKWI